MKNLLRFPWTGPAILFAAMTLISIAGTAAAQEGNMLYLVEFTANDAGTPTGREQAIDLLENLIVPSLEGLARDKRVLAGGLRAGARSGSFIVSAKSNDEVTALVRELPAWGVWDWKVSPLESFSNRALLERKMIKALREKQQ